MNTRRYWSGSAWTDHRMEKGAGQPPAPSSGSSGAWKWIGGIALAVVLAGVVLWFFFLSGTSVSSEDLEADIESGLQEQVSRGPTSSART